ncbi:MAG: DUF1573 domain-containing protein [Candidatus Hydrogenedentota bacterium]|nr:MAG: DUF1573 domain-containing protein [Candidatus Hydrogenedentota bacterium]
MPPLNYGTFFANFNLEMIRPFFKERIAFRRKAPRRMPSLAFTTLPSLLLLGSFTFFLAPPARARLTFHPTIYEEKADYLDTQTVAVYHFRNEGDKTVTIRKVRASCGCTVPQLDKRVYLPGETGVLRAFFAFGSRSGKQEKKIRIWTNEKDLKKPYELILRTEIPRAVRFSPIFLHWGRGDTPITRTVNAWVEADSPVKILSIDEPAPDFSVRLQVLKPGRGYLILVTPRDTAKPKMRRIDIQTDFPRKKPLSYSIYCSIR